jgi:hypothetical protein
MTNAHSVTGQKHASAKKLMQGAIPEESPFFRDGVKLGGFVVLGD